MQLKITIGVKFGLPYFEADGNTEDLYLVSRKLTGTTGEVTKQGILTIHAIDQIFECGNYEKRFNFPALLPGKEREMLLERVKAISEWTKSLDYLITFDI